MRITASRPSRVRLRPSAAQNSSKRSAYRFSQPSFPLDSRSSRRRSSSDQSPLSHLDERRGQPERGNRCSLWQKRQARYDGRKKLACNRRKFPRVASRREKPDPRHDLSGQLRALSQRSPKTFPAQLTDNRVQCERCLLCNGKKANIGIHAHGRAAKQVCLLTESAALACLSN